MISGFIVYRCHGKTNLHAVRHFIAFVQNIGSRLALMRTSGKTDFRSRDITTSFPGSLSPGDITENNFIGIDISQPGPGASLSVPLFSLDYPFNAHRLSGRRKRLSVTCIPYSLFCNVTRDRRGLARFC